MSTPTKKLTRELIDTACRAPSIHNTQPWAWRMVGADTIELRADRSRQLPRTDPQGRAMLISCGAALHHLVVAAEGFGLRTKTQVLPEGGDGDLLARIHLERGEIDGASAQMLTALENRQTDRRGFTDWEVPEGRLRHLVDAATARGAHAVAITDPGQAAQVMSLVSQAREDQRKDQETTSEQGDWIDRGGDDGIPWPNAFPHQREGVAAADDRFHRQPAPAAGTDRPATTSPAPGDALMLVFTAEDDQSAWLAAGQSLSGLWLRATLDGLSVAPETQVIEVELTRQLLRRLVLDGLGQPQVLVHVGWQESSRPLQAQTPRRSIDDVLLP